MSLSVKNWVVLILVCAESAAWAQGTLRDPTLPPPEVLSASGTLSTASTAQPSVQMVLVSSSRKYAVIDGQILKPGAQMDQWRLANITAKGVVMQSDNGSQTISAYPSVHKKVIAARAATPLSKPRNP